MTDTERLKRIDYLKDMLSVLYSCDESTLSVNAWEKLVDRRERIIKELNKLEKADFATKTEAQ